MMKNFILLLAIFHFIFLSAFSNQPNQENSQNGEIGKFSRNETKKIKINTTDKLIDIYKSRIKRNPNSYSNYTSLGEAFIQKSRETGDISYYNKAEGVLKKALELNSESYETMVYLGQVSSATHDFSNTAAYAKKAIEIRPMHSLAYGILGDAYVELGEYNKAEAAYQKMLHIQPSLDSYSRIAYIKELKGDVEGAIQERRRAVEEGMKQTRSDENIAWTQFILGETYFNKGDLADAEEQYKASLKTYNNYYYALSGLAKVKVVQENYEESINLYKKAIDVVPLPIFISSLGDVYKTIGDAKEAKKQYDLVEYIGLLNKVNKVVYNRGLSLFYADHDIKLDEALSLARKELDSRKDIYAYDTLAWALYKNGKLEEALHASKQSHKLGTKDAKLFFHTGMIYYKLGKIDKAKEYLNKTLSMNPYFHITHAKVAENTLKDIESKSRSAKNR